MQRSYDSTSQNRIFNVFEAIIQYSWRFDNDVSSLQFTCRSSGTRIVNVYWPCECVRGGAQTTFDRSVCGVCAYCMTVVCIDLQHTNCVRRRTYTNKLSSEANCDVVSQNISVNMYLFEYRSECAFLDACVTQSRFMWTWLHTGHAECRPLYIWSCHAL